MGFLLHGKKDEGRLLQIPNRPMSKGRVCDRRG